MEIGNEECIDTESVKKHLEVLMQMSNLSFPLRASFPVFKKWGCPEEAFCLGN